MKKLLFIFLLVPALSQAQFSINVGGGIGTATKYTGIDEVDRPVNKNTIAPVAKLSLSYQFSNIMLEAIEMPTITRTVNAPNYFGMRAGYNIASSGIIPSIGYFYTLRSEDDPAQNKWAPGIALKYQFNINERGGLYCEASYMKSGSAGITAGFIAQF